VRSDSKFYAFLILLHLLLLLLLLLLAAEGSKVLATGLSQAQSDLA
jgi:hypothetical protein